MSRVLTFSAAQAKSQLSALLDAVESGEDAEITRRGVPVAPHRFRWVCPRRNWATSLYCAVPAWSPAGSCPRARKGSSVNSMWKPSRCPSQGFHAPAGPVPGARRLASRCCEWMSEISIDPSHLHWSWHRLQ
ncbi:type II toxin-antitoxin system prevent-host-death family antitoxin [Synechococcus sp. HK05]|uniref:type II toxin-antitoxin system Phd/YefM family antitoxin n=1 Tax=Synechococcus sp. HK05 TaxID=2725975 RepID=UPI001C38B93F|nr:type II toxin-antitoxin system prevent-host-death family antitoxin [Synechococcus sp. HK05]